MGHRTRFGPVVCARPDLRGGVVRPELRSGAAFQHPGCDGGVPGCTGGGGCRGLLDRRLTNKPRPAGPPTPGAVPPPTDAPAFEPNRDEEGLQPRLLRPLTLDAPQKIRHLNRRLSSLSALVVLRARARKRLFLVLGSEHTE